MKLLITVHGGVVCNILASEPVSIYLIDHDNIKEKGGDTREARQAMQPYGIIQESGFQACIDEELEDYKEHELKIISLHDAQAECKCGHWYYAFTGELTVDEITQEYSKHLLN